MRKQLWKARHWSTTRAAGEAGRSYLDKSSVNQDSCAERVEDPTDDGRLGAVGIVRRADAKADGYANGCGQAIQDGRAQGHMIVSRWELQRRQARSYSEALECFCKAISGGEFATNSSATHDGRLSQQRGL